MEPPLADISTHSISLCHRLLATGRFLAMQPLVMVQLAKHLPIKALNVKFAGFSRAVDLMAVKGRTLSPLARRFVDCAREVARPLPKS